jgi:glycosyltransferase involved in cell wall biosynthesis
LFQKFESKQLIVKTIPYADALQRTWDGPDEGLLVVHSFHAWPKEQWETFLTKVKIPLFVIPTEFHINEILRTTFGHASISKIIVCSEYYQKYFLKVLNFDSNKIKLINLATDDLRPAKMLRKPKPKEEHEQKVILSPSLLTEDKDYEILLKSAKQLKYKYRNLIFALYLKSHPNLSSEKREEIITQIHNKAAVLGLGPNLRVLLDTKHPYQQYLKVADIIVTPIQHNDDIYSGTIIDAIVASKAIVTPDSKLAYDLCKKDAGIYLYATSKDVEAKPSDLLKAKKQVVPITNDEIVTCIVDDCSIILDSPEIKDIMEEQNSILAENYLFPRIAQQYLNLIRRFKTP